MTSNSEEEEDNEETYEDESESESDVDSSETDTIERNFPNGDFYTGQWYNDVPDGPGKYLWSDGCIYDGDWENGKMTGHGKFSWPSGTTYEGGFLSGFMHGSGKFTGTGGTTYRGTWSMNVKQGQGEKWYSNGDYYNGEWGSGQPNGNGRYVWGNGTEYVGEWKCGVIHGKGTLVWVNGNKYEGGWEDGLPRGNGSFMWGDGSLYIGYWGKEINGGNQKGVYYPSPTADSSSARDPNETLYGDLIECKVSQDETVSVLPSQKTMHWSGVGSGNQIAGMEGFRIWDSDGELMNALADASVGEGGTYQPTPLHLMKWPKEAKKQGETISKGHKNYELMLNLQLGIRHAVGKQAPATTLDLKSSAFDPKLKVWTKFPPEGSKHTPPHQSCDFRWKDYCPLVFRTLRKLFRVDPGEYMLSLCGNDALRELSSPGKSGSFFYLTNDDRYMIKTVKKSEVKVLLRMLPAYYNHVRAYENTLVTKFFGLHCVKLTGTALKKVKLDAQNVRFVIMGNLFGSDYFIHRRFDLKGSSHGRTTDKPESEITENTTLKDLDLNFVFRLQRAWFQEFCRQIDRDCEFLEQERIMDYSLLVGVHFKEPTGHDEHDATTSGSDTDQFLNPKPKGAIRLGINMPARVEQIIRRTDCEAPLIGEPTGEFYDVILFFGIIDILQDYDISKKLEHAYKSIQYDSTSISAVDPRQYAKRFKDFIFRVYAEDDNTSLI